MKKNILYAMILFFIIVSVIAVFANLSNTRLYVSPSSIIDKKIRIGDTFTVNVSIADVSNLKGYEFKLKYDKNILNATSVVQSTFLSSSPYCIRRIINETEGFIWIACMMPLNSGAGVSGSGTLETIAFKVLDKGESKIEFYKSVLGDSSGSSIAHTVENGYFTNLRNK